MLRAPPPARVLYDHCGGSHHTEKGFVSSRGGTTITTLHLEIPSPRMKLSALSHHGVGIPSYPVLCEAGGSKFASTCKTRGGRILGVAVGQGEKLVVRSVEALNFWLSDWKRRGFGGGSFGGGSGSGGGGDGGSASGDFNAAPVVEVLGYQEEEDDDQAQGSGERLSVLANLDARGDYFCSELRVVDLEGMELVEDSAPYKILGFTSGSRLSKADILEANSQLMSTGWYKTVDIRWVADSAHAIKLVVLTEDALYSGLSSFQCQSRGKECLLPKSIRRDITTMLQKQEKATRHTLSDIQERVESWYHNQGYVYANVKGFRTSGGGAGVLECEVDEGMISKISVSCEDEAGHPVACYTKNEIVLESLPNAVREGMQWNSGAGKAALKGVEQLELFDKVNIELAASDSGCGDREAGLLLHLRLKERPRQSADVFTEWSFLCNDAGRPDLRTLQPGGSLHVQHRNINGLNRNVSGSVTASNLLRPEDDLRFKLEYVHPLVKGLQCEHPRSGTFRNLHNHTVRLLAFNKRKLSATYYDADQFKEAPAVWIDRAGIKASVIEKLSEQSKLAYGVVVEEVATRDDVGTICKQRGSNDSIGIEHIAFLQMKLSRSNLNSGETGLIGARDVFQADQGMGLGTRMPMFNRHQLAMTRYMRLRNDTPEDQLPSVVVLHARYGGCLGDVVNYRSFANGGPYALRGNNIGELASFSRFIEVAGEVRFPVPQQMEGYCFADSLTSLQNFGAIWNNPSRLMERVGKGLMYGAGIKMGNLRIEYVIECNDQTGSLKVYTGERY